MESRNKLKMCRLCLCENECFINIFEMNEWLGYVAAEVIFNLLQFQVSETDGYPQVVCSKCLTKLTDFKLFKECCLTSKVTYDNIFISSESLEKVELEMEIDSGGSCLESSEQDPLRETSPDPVIKQEELDIDCSSGDASHNPFEGTDAETGFGPILLKHEVMPYDQNLQEKLIESGSLGSTDAGEPADTPIEYSTQHEGEICYNNVDKIKKVVELLYSGEDDDGLELRRNTLDYHQNTNASRKWAANGIQDKMTPTKDEINAQVAGYACGDIGTSSMSTKCLEHQVSHRASKRAVDPCTRKINIDDGSICKNSRDVSLIIEVEASLSVTKESLDMKCISPGETTYMDPLFQGHVGIGKEEEKEVGWEEEEKEEMVEGKRTSPQKNGRMERFECYHCGNILLTKHSLIQHMRVHGFGNSCETDVCAEVFRTNCYLRSHLFTQKERGKKDKNTRGKGERGRDSTSVKGSEGKKQRLECYHCGNVSMTKVGLLQHMKVHGFGNSYDCKVCGKVFHKNCHLRRHILIHTGSKQHKCEECNKLFRAKCSLTRHMRIHTCSKPYKCLACSKSFRDNSNLKSHMRIHTGSKPYKCLSCSKCFRDNSNLTSHMRTHTGSKPFKCSECNRRFSHSGSLTIHMRSHSNSRPYKCGKCGKSFSDNSNLRQHVRSHMGYKPYKCAECGKCFSNSSKFKIHMRSHSDYKPYKCGQCNKSYKAKANLVVHVRSHTGSKPYKCAECIKCFSSSTCLKAHMRTHTGVKPYKCTECSKCFSSSTHLNEHRRTHSGEKPFECAECSKCFSSSTRLNGHMRKHTGEKPHECLECSKTFAQRWSLNVHMRVHTGSKPFTCGTCTKSFAVSSSLKSHLLVHTKEKPFQCYNCSKRFSQGGSFNKHLEGHCKGKRK